MALEVRLPKRLRHGLLHHPQRKACLVGVQHPRRRVAHRPRGWRALRDQQRLGQRPEHRRTRNPHGYRSREHVRQASATEGRKAPHARQDHGCRTAQRRNGPRHQDGRHRLEARQALLRSARRSSRYHRGQESTPELEGTLEERRRHTRRLANYRVGSARVATAARARTRVFQNLNSLVFLLK